MYYIDTNIKELYRVFDQNERKGFLRLDLNENQGGLPQEFIDKVLSEVTPDCVSQYPETSHFVELLAKYLEVDSKHICLTNGSAEGIRYIIQAFTSEGGRIVGVTPSYMMFQVYSKMYNRKFVEVPYANNLTMDINNIIDEMTEDTQLLVLLNPNNPMGNVYSESEIKRLVDEAKKNEITILIDEAYYDFCSNTFIQYALEDEHIFVTRTFSKFFSMASCRLGYVVGWTEGVEMVHKLCTPHNINAFAIRFAEAILESPSLVEGLHSKFDEGRVYLENQLDANGYLHIGEAGNFIFIKPKTDADLVVNKMKRERRILIKSYTNVGKYGKCLRVTIGERRYMEQFISALLELDIIETKV